MGLYVWQLDSTSGKDVLKGNAMPSLLIGADLVPTKSNAELFAAGDVETLVGAELRKILADADYRIFNLETPLADVESPIAKCGPNLIAPTSTIHGYKAIGADILTLANNHILDHGLQALDSTRRLLKENGIAFFGVGDTPQEAAEPYVFEFAGKKIGLYACAEHEFSIVTDKTSGANPFDPLESLDHVAALKARCDFVVVLYHGGKEHYRYPSPNLRKVCRKLVEKGVNLVVCQHSHCVGCEEKYRDGTIVYGQGNFLFDHSESEFWQTGLLLSLDADFNVSYLPLTKDGNKVKLAQESQAKEILDGFKTRSREITVDGVVEAKYAELAKSIRDSYLARVSATRFTFLFRVLNKLTGGRWARRARKRRFTPKALLGMRNYVECEAHRELLLSANADALDAENKK